MKTLEEIQNQTEALLDSIVNKSTERDTPIDQKQVTTLDEFDNVEEEIVDENAPMVDVVSITLSNGDPFELRLTNEDWSDLITSHESLKIANSMIHAMTVDIFEGKYTEEAEQKLNVLMEGLGVVQTYSEITDDKLRMMFKIKDGITIYSIVLKMIEQKQLAAGFFDLLNLNIPDKDTIMNELFNQDNNTDKEKGVEESNENN